MERNALINVSRYRSACAGAVMSNGASKIDLVADELCNALGLAVRPVFNRELTGGFTDARVFAEDIDSYVFSGEAIIKLRTSTDSGAALKKEKERHLRAVSDAQQFSEQHIPKVIYTLVSDNRFELIITSIAGSSLRRAKSFSDLSFDQKRTVLERLAYELLQDWNEDYELKQNLKASDILRGQLRYKYREIEGARAPDWLRARIKLDPEETTFSTGGEWYPNPLAYVRNSELWPQSLTLSGVRGKSHRDLHQGNVIVRVEDPTRIDYFLIDMATYQNPAYLFYDQAYLELALLLSHSSEDAKGTLAGWIYLCDMITNGQYGNIDATSVSDYDYGIVNLVSALRTGTWKWVEGRERDRQDSMEAQLLLSHVSAGIAFCHKEISDEERWRSFLYAARHLKEFLAIQNEMPEWKGPSVGLSDSQGIVQFDDSWMKVWEFCDDFPSHYLNILVLGPSAGASGDALRILAAVDWDLVLDFSSHDEDNLDHGSSKPLADALAQSQGLVEWADESSHQELPRRRCVWYRMPAAETTDPEQSLRETRTLLPKIRNLVSRLRYVESTGPSSVLLLEDGLDPALVRRILESLDEVLGDSARYSVVTSEDQSASEEILPTDLLFVGDVTIPVLLASLSSVFRIEHRDDSIVLPARRDSHSSRDQVTMPRSSEDYHYVAEDLEIIHPGLATGSNDVSIGEQYWRGGLPTWSDIDARSDIPRRATGPIQAKVLATLDNSKTHVIPVYHRPGAGGTTVARRIAWDLKGQYPTAIVKKVAEATPARIRLLADLTQLPVLLVLDGISETQREDLYKALEADSTRATLLWFSRTLNSNPEGGIPDPMKDDESRDFYNAYRALKRERTQILSQLTNSNAYVRYRTPFFYGLFTFESEFTSVDKYVQHHMHEIAPEAQAILLLIAITTRYAQTSIRDTELAALLAVSSSRLRISEILGTSASNLVVRQASVNGDWRVVHPVIAEESLKQLLGGEDEWKSELADLCCTFIERLAKVASHPNSHIEDLVTDLFISRTDTALDETSPRQQFSDLILEIPSKPGQNRVLTRLTEAFPRESHYLNHLARHHLYVMESSLEQCESLLLEAIEIDEDDPIHYHTLGMVYRHEVRRLLRHYDRSSDRHEEAFRSIVELFDRAANQFRTSREKDPDSEYGYVSHAQLIVGTIIRLRDISSAESFPEFVSQKSTLGDWIRSQITTAEDLLEKLRSNRDPDSASRYVPHIETGLGQIYGDLQSVIDGLGAMLGSSSAGDRVLRSSLARAMFAKADRNWQRMDSKDCRFIYQLMDRNVRGSYDDGDMRHWFNAFRRLPEFDSVEALERLTYWGSRSNSIDAHYYLYILQFIRWRDGLLAETEPIIQAIYRCRELAPRLGQNRNREWLAKSPEWFPVIPRMDLGTFMVQEDTYENIHLLARMQGRISGRIRRQSGRIRIARDLDAFFVPSVPGHTFYEGRDEEREVEFYIAFRYSGLMAYKVTPVES